MKIDLIILCLCYGIITFIFLLDIINIFRRTRYISMYLLCKIMFCIVEGIVPLIIHAKYYKDLTLSPWNIYIEYSNKGINALMLAGLFAVIGYIFISLGYHCKYKIVFSNKKFNVSSNLGLNYRYDKILRYTCMILLVISIISMFIWTKAYGGIMGFIMNANAIRSGVTKINNSYGFFKHFASVIAIPSYGFFILNIFAKKKKCMDIILWVVSVIFAVEYLLASDGRMTAGFYFISYVAIYMQSKSKLLGEKISYKTTAITICLFVLAMLLMLKMDDFTYFIRNGVWNISNESQQNNLVESFIYELSFVVKSEQVVIMKSQQIGLQFLNDIGYGLFAWLPSSLVPSSFPRLWTLNSELSGIKSGELPCGIIAQGYYDLRIIGIMVFPFIYGWIIKAMDSIEIRNPYGMTMYAALFYSIIRLVSYGMVYDLIQGLFDVFVLIIVYFILSQILKINVNNKHIG